MSSSQGTTAFSQESGSWCGSMSSITEDEKKRQLLDNFLERSKVNPTVHILQKKWSDLGEKSKHHYIAKASDILQAGLSVITPGQEREVTETFFRKLHIKYALDMADYASNDILEILMTVYAEADTWQMKKVILSIVAPHYSLEEIQRYSNNVTKYLYTDAKRHAVAYGAGKNAPTYVDAGTSRIDNASLEHFIQYLFSPSISLDCPFGEKTLKLSSGDKFKVPAIIMRTVRTDVVRLYISYCKQNGYKCHSMRTYMRILEAIGPRIRKQMRGLDNYAADGTQAFDDLESKISEIFDENDVHEIKLKLKKSKHYLKMEYKVCNNILAYLYQL